MFYKYFIEIGTAYWETNATVKAEKMKIAVDETLPYYLQKLDDIAKTNKGYFALGRLTWADLFFVASLDYLGFVTSQDLTAKYPNLKAVKNNVMAIENIKKWVAKRPVSQM